MKRVTVAQALMALDHMDDYARMTVGVDAIGARTLLERFIRENTPEEEQAPEPALLLPDEQTGTVALMPEAPALIVEPAPPAPAPTAQVPEVSPENFEQPLTEAPSAPEKVVLDGQALPCPEKALQEPVATSAEPDAVVALVTPSDRLSEPLEKAPSAVEVPSTTADVADLSPSPELPAEVLKDAILLESTEACVSEELLVPAALKGSRPPADSHDMPVSLEEEAPDETAAYLDSQRQLGEAFEERYPEIYQHRCAMGMVPCAGPEFDAMQKQLFLLILAEALADSGL